MRFNGVDLNTIHTAISRSHEFPPGMPRRSIATVDGSAGETVVSVTASQEEYMVRVNIAGRSYQEAMEARDRLAAWAMSSGRSTAQLEPTHARGRAYNAIFKSCSKLEKRFGTVDVVFMLPDGGVQHETTERHVTGAGSVAMAAGGTAATWPDVLSLTMTDAAEEIAITLDGAPYVQLGGEFAAGDVVEIRPRSDAVMVNGEHAENRIVCTGTFTDRDILPGKHELAAQNAQITARWHNRWL